MIKVDNIYFTYPSGIEALNGVTLKIRDREFVAIMGENGAGKSTLMKVLSGVYSCDTYTGEIIYNNKIQYFKHISDSERVGIGIIYQELALIPEMTVYENIFLGHEFKTGITINWNETIKKANDVLKKVRLSLNPDTKIKELGVGKQQLVE